MYRGLCPLPEGSSNHATPLASGAGPLAASPPRQAASPSSKSWHWHRER